MESLNDALAKLPGDVDPWEAAFEAVVYRLEKLTVNQLCTVDRFLRDLDGPYREELEGMNGHTCQRG